MERNEMELNAEQLEREKKFAEAAESWGQLAMSVPQSSPGRDALVAGFRLREAGARFQGGQLVPAIAILEDLRRNGDDAEVLGVLGRVYLDADRFEDAIEVGRQAISLDPDGINIRKVVGRAHKAIAERTPANAAIHWQEAIDQFTDILLRSPRDELVKALKLDCVRKRDDSFGQTMQCEFQRFEQLMEAGDRDKAMAVLRELVRVVIQHAVDLQQQLPQQSVRVARGFITMIENSRHGLAESLAYVFAQLRGLEMWAHLKTGEEGAARNALDEALRLAPEQTLPWALKAEFMFVRKRSAEIDAAMQQAERNCEDEYDKLIMSDAHTMLGNFAVALEWLDRIDLERLKEESYRPDRAERIVARMRADLEDALEYPVTRSPEDFESGELADQIKRMLSGGGNDAMLSGGGSDAKR